MIGTAGGEHLTRNGKILDRMMERALSGEGAHVETKEGFSGLGWQKAGARPRGAPHSLYQLLNHMIFWQEWVLAWLEGPVPATPEHAPEGWPGGVTPRNQDEWEQAVRRFQRGLMELDHRFRRAAPFCGRGRKSRLEMAQTIGAHNIYHAGQAAVLRQILGTWPPPSGGLTW